MSRLLDGQGPVASAGSQAFVPSVSRWRTLVCALAGHEWTGFETRTEVATGRLTEREADCARCRMSAHDVWRARR